MPDIALENLAVYQLCAFAARRKAFVRLANAASSGGCKRDDRLAGQIIALKERIDNRRRDIPPGTPPPDNHTNAVPVHDTAQTA